MDGEPLSASLIGLATGVALLACTVRGITGFGGGIVMMPVLTLFMDLKLVVVAGCAMMVANGLSLARSAWPHVDWRSILWLFPSNLVGLAVGTHLLVSVSAQRLRACFGALVCVFALQMVWQEWNGARGEPKPWPQWLGPIAGLVGGVTAGVFGVGAPPIVIYLAHRLSAKEALRATFIILFLMGDVVRAAGYVAAYLVTKPVVVLACFLVPAAFLGGYVGTRLQERMNARAFRLAVAALLVALGVALLVR
ncbi:MAG: sulfite exporter TauE/SafE family protein [Planctomycetes bacterium]|nr:sulfite exporter TauE/SafE family protein [Planctomycetota bacterium]